MKKYLVAYYTKNDVIAEKVEARNQKDAIEKLKIAPHRVIAITKIKF